MVILILIVFTATYFFMYWAYSSKVEEYEKIIDDLIHYMNIKDYNSFVDWANYTKNGKSRYKWYTFCNFSQKRTYKNEKDLIYKKK